MTVIKPEHSNPKHAIDGVPAELVHAYQSITDWFNRDSKMNASELANFADTPVRAAKALMEMNLTKTEIYAEVERQLATGFPSGHTADGVTQIPSMILQGPISIVSLCPHHLLPVEGTAFVAYIPDDGGTVLGLSKITRIAEVLAKRPVLQEQLTEDIANVFYDNETSDLPAISSRGSAVWIRARHGCMSYRGVKSNAYTVTTALRDAFYASELRQEFLANIAMLIGRM